MVNPYYRPWIGHNYGVSADGLARSPKVMILGESHYTPQGVQDSPNRVFDLINVVSNNREREEGWRRRLPFHGRIFRLFTGKRRGEAGPQWKKFWDSVLFQNYIQESVGSGPGDRPTESMWKQAREPFRQILKKHKPDCVLVIGYALWGHLHDVPDGCEPLLKCRLETAKHDLCEVSVDGTGTIPITTVSHPSSRVFRHEVERQRVVRLLNEAEKQLGPRASTI
jgi:hypothetical protein